MLIRLLLLLLFAGVGFLIVRAARPHPLLRQKREWKALGRLSPLVKGVLDQRQTAARLVRRLGSNKGLLDILDNSLDSLVKLNDVAPQKVHAQAAVLGKDAADLIMYLQDKVYNRGGTLQVDKLREHQVALAQEVAARREIEGGH